MNDIPIDLDCPECGAESVTTVEEHETVPGVFIPVRHCTKCPFEWTDGVADDIVTKTMEGK